MRDPTPVGAFTHGPGLDGNDPIPRHASRGYYYMNDKVSLVLGDDQSHMVGSDDIQLGVVVEEIVWIYCLHI